MIKHDLKFILSYCEIFWWLFYCVYKRYQGCEKYDKKYDKKYDYYFDYFFDYFFD
jgi:hypothetical protein